MLTNVLNDVTIVQQIRHLMLFYFDCYEHFRSIFDAPKALKNFHCVIDVWGHLDNLTFMLHPAQHVSYAGYDAVEDGHDWAGQLYGPPRLDVDEVLEDVEELWDIDTEKADGQDWVPPELRVVQLTHAKTWMANIWDNSGTDEEREEIRFGNGAAEPGPREKRGTGHSVA